MYQGDADMQPQAVVSAQRAFNLEAETKQQSSTHSLNVAGLGPAGMASGTGRGLPLIICFDTTASLYGGLLLCQTAIGNERCGGQLWLGGGVLKS